MPPMEKRVGSQDQESPEGRWLANSGAEGCHERQVPDRKKYEVVKTYNRLKRYT